MSRHNNGKNNKPNSGDQQQGQNNKPEVKVDGAPEQGLDVTPTVDQPEVKNNSGLVDTNFKEDTVAADSDAANKFIATIREAASALDGVSYESNEEKERLLLSRIMHNVLAGIVNSDSAVIIDFVLKLRDVYVEYPDAMRDDRLLAHVPFENRVPADKLAMYEGIVSILNTAWCIGVIPKQATESVAKLFKDENAANVFMDRVKSVKVPKK
tara:strand:+ start:133082 stop:133714 length:633 start_codon:yes stop_codon:yes gene_type:complete